VAWVRGVGVAWWGFSSSLGEGPKSVEGGPFELNPDESLNLRVFVDKSVVEVFANDRQAADMEVKTQEGFILRSLRTPIKVGSEVHVVVRAEDADILPKGPGGDRNKLQGVLKGKTFLFGFIDHVIELETGQEVHVEVPSTMLDRDWELGEEVDVTFNPEKVYIFQKEETP